MFFIHSLSNIPFGAINNKFTLCTSLWTLLFLLFCDLFAHNLKMQTSQQNFFRSFHNMSHSNSFDNIHYLYWSMKKSWFISIYHIKYIVPLAFQLKSCIINQSKILSEIFYQELPHHNQFEIDMTYWWTLDHV